MEEYVYIFSNRTMPGLLKVGCTSHNPQKRAKKLYNNTGVPAPFTVEYYIKINDYQTVEHETHRVLKNYNVNKEFFQCDLVACIQILKKVASNNLPYSEWYRDDFIKDKINSREKEYMNDIVMKEAEERRKKDAKEPEIIEHNRWIKKEAERVELQKKKGEAEFQEFKDKELKKASKFSKIFTILWGLIFISIGIYSIFAFNHQSTKNILFSILFFGGIGSIVLIIGLNMGNDGYYLMRGAKNPDEFDKLARKKFIKSKWK